MNDQQAQKQIIEIGQKMYQLGMVAANDGNISCRLPDGTIWATPTGVSKGSMTDEMLIKLDIDGNLLQGNLEPSSELKMHLSLYRTSDKIKAVTHAHPAHASAFAVANIPLEIPYMPEAVINLGTVPVVPYATPGSLELAEGVAEYAQNRRALLLANHGAVSWGESLKQAFFRLETLEHYAKIIILSKHLLGQAQPLPAEEVAVLENIRQKLEN